MTFSGIIMGISLIIVFIQWKTPLIYLLMNDVITSKTFKIRRTIGNWMVYSLLFFTFAGLFSSEYYPKLFLGISIIIGLLILTVMFYSIDVHSKASKLAKAQNDKLLIFLRMPYVIMIVLFLTLILDVVLPMITSDFNMKISTMISFKLSSNVAIIMLIRIILFAFVTMTAYAVVIFQLEYENSPDRIGLVQIRNRLKPNRILLVITVGVFLSFFHFAELDFSTIGTADDFELYCTGEPICDIPEIRSEYIEKFNDTLTVYHLIATALFIPLFIDKLRDDDKAKPVNKRHLGIGTTKFRRRK